MANIGSAIKFIFEDHSPEYLKELEKKKLEILKAFGNELQKSIQNFMIEDKIYDTGRLHGSISYCTPSGDFSNLQAVNSPNDAIKGLREKDTVFYGSAVNYAEIVENGSTKQRARRYVKTGTYRAKPKLKAVMEKILKEN